MRSAPAPDCVPAPDVAEALSRARAGLNRVPPVLVALSAQLIAALVVAPLAQAGALPLPAWLAHGLMAAVAGSLLGLPRWWLPINLGFVPGALWLDSAQLRSGWFLAAFVAMVTVFWTTHRSRVPLYLSGRRAYEELARLLPRERAFRFLDLGCGFGGVLDVLSRCFPLGQFSGLEIAPLPAWIARMRGRGGSGFYAARGDFFQLDLSGFDVIYAFLSPAPMEALWAKVVREARPGTLFVSNSFGVPGVEPHQRIPLGPGQRALYVWRF